MDENEQNGLGVLLIGLATLGLIGGLGWLVWYIFTGA